MTNQAAQTMPELPPSFARVHNDGYWTLRVRDTAEFIVHDSRQTPAQEVYSSGQMRAMYQQGYAAALAQTAGVPDGWKLVPVEPTEVMCEAAMSSLGWTRSEAAAKTAPITPASPMMEGSMKVWSAMLAAAPAASDGDGNKFDCDDPTCGCKDPAFTEPMEALEFLSGRFKYAGVSHAVARSYARDIDAILAAQPSSAASVAHPDALPDGTLSKSTAKRVEALAASGGEDGWSLAMRVREALDRASCPDHFMRIAVETITGDAPHPPASASVSERARDDRFTAMLIGIIADVQDALGFTDEDKECSNGSLEIVAAIRELKEQALTQQRGEAAASGEGVGGE